MIKLNSTDVIKENREQKSKEVIKERETQDLAASMRPEVVDAKVYKLKSAFVKNSVFITLSYIKSERGLKPIEIFINSKDLTKTSEYVVLTRLISAIFRRSGNPMFILEELQGIFDPNGGSFKEGKYYHSFYSEIADVIERFFYDVKIIEKANQVPVNDNGVVEEPSTLNAVEFNNEFRICPTCSSKSLKTENGCDSCMSCGYSKCDK
jgi:ribonucleoside-diphosphate reductase alpha chain